MEAPREAAVVSISKMVFNVPIAPNVGRAVTAGRYDWVDERIAKDLQFPSEHRRIKQMGLLAVGNVATVSSMLSCIRDAGFEPAGSMELLSFGAAFPDWRQECRVVSLQEISNAFGRYFLSLSCRDNERILELVENAGNWTAEYMVLAIPCA